MLPTAGYDFHSLGTIRNGIQRSSPPSVENWRPFRTTPAELAQDLLRVARDLHPAVLKQLGFVNALEMYCDEVSMGHGITAHCSSQLEGHSVRQR